MKNKKLNMKLELDRKKAILFGVPVFGLLIGLIGYLAFVSPQKAKAHSAAAQVAALQAQLAAASKPTQKPVPVQAADLFRLAKAMPDSPDVPGMLRDLSRVARASKVSIDSLSPSPATALATGGYGVLPVTIQVSGKFGDISKFLAMLRDQVKSGKKLRVGGRLFVTNRVSFTSGEKETLSASLNLDAFIYGMAPPPPPAPTTTTDSTGGTP